MSKQNDREQRLNELAGGIPHVGSWQATENMPPASYHALTDQARIERLERALVAMDASRPTPSTLKWASRWRRLRGWLGLRP